jgi:antitoxin component of RelBE/YafQ-DinJ toxin-antitoxin module
MPCRRGRCSHEESTSAYSTKFHFLGLGLCLVHGYREFVVSSLPRMVFKVHIYRQSLRRFRYLLNQLGIIPSMSIRLTLRSSRTPPALPFALFQLLAISASLIASVQAWPLSFIR